ncbi:hypothetical protein CMI47_21110 [Candidatus Pacearchaeota archaeon]|nr:hypothetical protein [Candidatus Pacearchaeota archaeon]|tara:strand:- start:255 stop:854 length:600 start_codon:yes stop_codon:yes gene_type:complete
MIQEEFYQKVPEWISQDKDRWNHITLMAYFCHKYQEKHGVRFRLVRWNTDPGKGKESRDFARLLKVLAPEGYEDLPSNDKKEIKKEVILKIYNYINWMFDYKFRRGDKSVTGTQIFLLPSMINEFERMYSDYVIKNGQNLKINTLLKWAKNNLPKIFDLHQVEALEDIKMIEKYFEAYSLTDSSIEYSFLKKAKELRLL